MSSSKSPTRSRSTTKGSSLIQKRRIEERQRPICVEDDCPKFARPSSMHCSVHGGGERCQEQNCSNGASANTGYCKKHGGGYRCQYPGCSKSANLPMYCNTHRMASKLLQASRNQNSTMQ